MKRKTMRSILALLLLLIPVLAAGRAEQAEQVTQTVQLPGSPWAVSIPKEMRYDGPRNGDGSCVFAYWLPDGTGNGARMEIDFFFYASEGMNLPEAARAMAEAGMDVEIREVNGIEMICGTGEDPADGAPCISYGMLTGDRIVEVVFWCSDQETADLSKRIMESIRPI